MSSSNDSGEDGSRPQLVGSKAPPPGKPLKRRRPRRADEGLNFQLIDCRPNLFECLAKASADISLWHRSLLVLRVWLDQILVRHRQSTSHMNDNRP